MHPPLPNTEPGRSDADARGIERLLNETNRILAGDTAAADRLRVLSANPTIPERLRVLAASIGRLADAHRAQDRAAARMQAALSRKQDELRAAMNDPLTGLPNRARFEDTLREAMATAQSGGGHMALAFIDLDRVKPVNDVHGHAAGDALLREAARRIRSSIRANDVAARIGGDEFGVVLREVPDRTTAQAVSGRIITALGRPIRIEHHDLHIGASVGLAFYPGDGRGAKDLLRRADCALYRAKAAGGNRTECWSQADAPRTRRACP